MSDNFDAHSRHGHTRKLLVIVDETPEVYCALFYAAGRVQHAGGRVQLLYVIEPENHRDTGGALVFQLSTALAGVVIDCPPWAARGAA